MTSMNILGVVVLFNPDIEKFIENTEEYIKDISRLIIWQNSLLKEYQIRLIKERLSECDKIELCGDGNNQGLDVAFNYALKYAITNGFDWLLTMDQDSRWINFSEYVSKIAFYRGNGRIFGPTTINKFENQKITEISNTEYSYTDFVISSGAVYFVNSLMSIGGFANGYFIDAIDEEVCFRAKTKDIQTIRINNSFLEQEFGAYRKRKVFCKEVATSNYSAFRYYYIVRNHIWLIKTGFVDRNIEKKIVHSYVVMPLVKVLLFEKQKFKKCVEIVRGYYDGVLKKPETFDNDN